MELLEENYKCKTLFDFQSVIEIMRFCKGFLDINDHYDTVFPLDFDELSHNQKFFWWLEKVQEQQDNQAWEYKFSNAIKGLHHWFRHPHGFKNLEDYYAKMNEFFKNNKYIMELDTQNGVFLNRSYENEKYKGSFMVALDDSGRTDCVATFQKRRKQQIIYLDEKSVASVSNIVFTDISFKHYVSDNTVSLRDDIAVVKIPNTTSMLKYVSRTAKFSEKNIMILFFNEIKSKQDKKQKQIKVPETQNTADRTIVLSNELLSIKKLCIEKNLSVIMFYPFETPGEVVGILEAVAAEKFKILPIKDNLITNNDAVDLKTFIENHFNMF